MRKALMAVLAVAAALGAVWTFGPREEFDRGAGFDEAALPADLDAYLAAGEAALPDITPGAEKEIVWAGAPGARTPLAIVYLHGFSATKQEIRPAPDMLAARFGANLYYARFAGHGRPGAALGTATAGDWWRDAQEALAIGRRLGDKVVVIGTSTGATMATLALADGDAARGVVGFVGVSPNFLIKGAPLFALTAPFARQILPLIFGETRSWTPLNEEHGKWWTTSYPLVATLPLGAVVSAARAVDFEAVETPALFVFSDDDAVVDHRETRRFAARWGGPAAIETVTPGPGDSPSAHVIAGDVTSPGLTDDVATIIGDWIAGLAL